MLAACAAAGEGARWLAGGQSLVPALNMRLLEPELLIDLNGLAELTGIDETAGGLRLGALTRHAELSRSPLVARLAPLLARAAPHIAHAAIRNRGTLGGSLAHADPAAELPACAVALDALLHIQGPKGTRRIAARDFFTGVFSTALMQGEIIVAIEIPKPAPGTLPLFAELARRQGDYAIAGIAGTARLEAGLLREARLVFFGIGNRPVEAPQAAAALVGRQPERIDAAVAALARDLDPTADLNASAAMKRQLAGVLLGRALGGLMAQAA